MTQTIDINSSSNVVTEARHYYNGTAAIEIIDSLKLPFCLSTMYKYCRRLGKKGDASSLNADINKMLDYINIQRNIDSKKTKFRSFVEKLQLFPFGVPKIDAKFALDSANLYLEHHLVELLIDYMNSYGEGKIKSLDNMTAGIKSFINTLAYEKMFDEAALRSRINNPKIDLFGAYEFVKLFMKFPSKTKKSVLQQALIDATDKYKITVENLNDALDLLSMYEVSLKFRSVKVDVCLSGLIEDMITKMEEQQTDKEQQ